MGFDKAKIISAAEKYLAQGKIPSAIGEYRRVIERDPNDYNALNTLGDLYARTKKIQDAIDCFQLVADHYREQGFTLKAIAIYKKIARLDPNLPAIAQRLAVLYEQQGHFVEAREQYLSIADAYARAGQMRESLAALRRSADLEPNNVEIRLRLGAGYLREELREEAADAFTEAGERLLARGEAKQALEAYEQASEVRPQSHAVLQGLAAAHVKLGAPDEAAAVLEQAVAAAPTDVELHAMLARAYLDSEDAPAAERATQRLVDLETSTYPQLFEVARLYLQRGDAGAAVRVLCHALEPALAGRQEQVLLGLLNESLARDPEQLEALRLLLRIYTWQRDDDRMRVTLERLAEVAQTHHLIDEERRALEHLVRLVPFDQSYHERLHELGPVTESVHEDSAAADAGSQENFETLPAEEISSFDDVIERSGISAPTQSAPAESSGESLSEFEWNSVAVPETVEERKPEEPTVIVDPSSSFADLNDDFAAPAATSVPGATALDTGEIDVSSSFGEVAFAPDSSPGATGGGANDERVKALLAQELESVDFYLAQGYADIAHATLDMLENQYGANEEIHARRRQLPQDELPAPQPSLIMMEDQGDSARAPETLAAFESSAQFEFAAAIEEAETEEVEFDDQLFMPAAQESADEDVPFPHEAPSAAPSVTMPPPEVAAPSSSGSAPPVATPHADLADIFSEFSDEVEAIDSSNDDDYETHYNTALAYREMGLIDQAIEELQASIALVTPPDGTSRYLQCCNLLGHCFMEKNMLRPAAMWFKKGLDTPGHTEDEYQALRYECGMAYEQMGDLERALEIFSEVYAIDVNYRGVAAKLRDLQAIRK
jgi:tetratricopeptide (TPR) repeat protein